VSRALTLLIALVLGAACALLVACGSSEKLLPGDTAKEIRSNLDTAESLFQEQQCSEAADAAREVRNDVGRLPRSVDRKLRKELRRGADNLIQLIETECVEATTQTITTEAVQPPAEAPPPVETQPEKKKPKEPKPPKEPTPQDGGHGPDGGGVSPPGQEGGGGTPED
jgi:hypothetical protein